MSNLSGRAWIIANQGRYPRSQDLDDLQAGFRENVIRFINILRNAGVRVSVTTTRRSADRAYLMHYSWRIANEDIDAADVPAKAGIDIQWNHGNNRVSIRAARAMVNYFESTSLPALITVHTRGRAIDMTITWRRDLFLGPLPDGSFRGVIGGPRNGGENPELREIGALFGVRKNLSSPSHWSVRGN